MYSNWNSAARPIERVALRAELIGVNTAVVRGLGVTVCGATPIIETCKTLLLAGVDPATPLVFHRGGVPVCHVHIGAAANLEINSRGDGFVRGHERRRATPVRQNQSGYQNQGLLPNAPARLGVT